MIASRLINIRRLLVANRGEIAVRIIRACRELDVETVQVHTEADRDSLAVKLADRAICIGTARSRESYLNIPFLVSAATTSKADAIHPGYGFLSENAAFAQACVDAGVRFVGPSAHAISSMGDKASARALAKAAGVPTTPGSEGVVSGADEARRVADSIGYPVLLKASAGGGGRGMRVVHRAEELLDAFNTASREATAAFGNGAMYVERFLSEARHVEIQVMGDGENVIHFGERDCSVQRRNQKLVEEAPAPHLPADVRDAMGAAAVKLCRQVNYVGAGTVEFIVDPGSHQYYFMEMNTRIQVEHPVTELVTGFDLVKEQISIADGQRLSLSQQDVRFDGHALECRINAEDPAAGFAPSPGALTRFRVPGGPGVRVDTHGFDGYRIPPFYDSLLAKLLTWGRTREEAVARMQRALAEFEIEGVKTTLPFHRQLMQHERFRSGRVHTRFVETEMLKAAL